MLAIRALIKEQLEVVHPRVYYQVAPETALLPYLVYDISPINDDGENISQMAIGVDGWDKNDDTTILETLMAAVKARLDKRPIFGTGFVLILYFDTQTSLIDSDLRIKRRVHLFQARKIGN